MKVTRRLFLLVPSVLYGQDSLLVLLGNLAEALSTGNAAAFLEHFDPNMPGYDKLREDVRALVAQWEIATSIEPIRRDGETAALDWFLDLRSREPSGPFERRREVVTIKGEGKKITALSPLSFFDPVFRRR